VLAPGLFAETIQSGGGVIPHIADGAGAQTVITLVNMEDTPASYALTLYNDSGGLLVLVTDAGTASSFSARCQPRITHDLDRWGESDAIAGWALLSTTGTIGGAALFRISVAPWIGFGGDDPPRYREDYRFSLIFDNGGNIANGFAMANPLSTAVTISVAFKDENGIQFLSDAITLPPMSHQSLCSRPNIRPPPGGAEQSKSPPAGRE